MHHACLRMTLQCVLFLLVLQAAPTFCSKEFSLARFSDILVYVNNSVIDIELIGEGYPGIAQTDGGALECHTDDTNCCRSTDGVAGGEWYGPDGNVIIAANQIRSANGLYRTRDHMVIRLNRRGGFGHLLTGLYRCEIPGPGDVTITRFIILTSNEGLCAADLPLLINGDITYTPPRQLSPSLPDGQQYQGTIATYSCSSGYQLVGGSTQRACICGTWNGTEPSCGIDCGPLTSPANGQVDTSSGTTFGSTATYICNTGYTLVGSPSRTCGADGNWTPTAPICKIKDCGLLTSPSNGQVDTSSGTTFGSTATYTCNNGFTLSGLGARTCGAAGNWTTAIPVCERVIFQLRFGPLNCIQYSSFNSLQKIAVISTELVDNVVRLCSCHFNSSFLLDPHLQCFPESPQTVTFRAQLSGSIQITAMKLGTYIQEWINSSQHFTLNGVRLSLNKSCDLVIPIYDAEECPITTPESTSTHLPTTNQPSSESISTTIGVIAGGALAGVAVIVLLIAILILCFFYCKRKISRKEDQSYEDNKQQNIEESAEYDEIANLKGYIETRPGQPHPPQGDYKFTECEAYNTVTKR